MDTVRAFAPEDIGQVADLHRRVFHTSDHFSQALEDSYRCYFQKVFLGHPWYDERLPSLVYVDGRGKIVGFLGVTPRRMLLNDRPIQAVVSSQFIVEPDSRSTLAAVKLLKAFASLPFDLSIADEANHTSRKLWESLGGSTALLYSMYWLRPLRPSEFVMRSLRKRGLPAVLAFGSAPFCRLFDFIMAQNPRVPFRLDPPSVSGSELSGEILLHCLSEFTTGWSLRPEYDERSVKWLLELLAERNGRGTFQKVVVQNAAQEIVGWYVWHLTREGVGEVLQIGAKNGWIGHVLDHLFYYARQRGALALSGRLEPKFLEHFYDRRCLFQDRGYWMLVHSKRPELLEAFHRGDAFVSRLEGEWCLSFKLD